MRTLSLSLCVSLTLSFSLCEKMKKHLGLVTAQLWVTNQHPHLLKIDIALTKHFTFWYLPIEACKLGVSVFMLSGRFWLESLWGFNFPHMWADEDDLKKILQVKWTFEPPLAKTLWMWAFFFFWSFVRFLYFWFHALLVVITKSFRSKLQNQLLTSTTGQ